MSGRNIRPVPFEYEEWQHLGAEPGAYFNPPIKRTVRINVDEVISLKDTALNGRLKLQYLGKQKQLLALKNMSTDSILLLTEKEFHDRRILASDEIVDMFVNFWKTCIGWLKI